MRSSQRPRELPARLVWFTNLSAPYRRPMWAALAHHVSLSVGLLAASEQNRRWTAELPGEVSHHQFRAGVLRAKLEPLYLLKGRGLRGYGRGDAVVLPGWEHPAAWQLLAEAAVRGVATVAFYESNRQSQRFAHGPIACARAWFFRHVDAALTVGQASRSVAADSGMDPARLVMTHNSIDTKAFTAAQIGPSARDTFAGRFAYVGQLIKRKNVESLLRALADCDDDYVLDVIGEGPLGEDLQRFSRELGIGERVTFHGYVAPEGMAERLCVVSTLVLPSTIEVYGLAPVEALALGRHVVISSVAGVAADIAGMPGVWVTEPEPAALADAMRSSRIAWKGPIASPPVLEWSPEQFAADTVRAVGLAVSRRQRRHRG